MLSDASIILRVKRFLGSLLPFQYFSESDLAQMARQVQVSVVKDGQVVFNQGQLPGDYFYIVKKGAVEIIDLADDLRILVDKCGEGDMFGIRPILAKSPYAYEAMTTEDCILYQVHTTVFKEIYYEYPEAVDYMIERFAAGRSIRDDYARGSASGVVLPAALSVRPTLRARLVTAMTTATAIEAIHIMHEAGVSSVIIIDSDKRPCGIITDRDIRRLTATRADIELPVSDVMSHPVRCITPDLSLQDIQLTMIDSGLHHLCVTLDGSDQSEAISIVTEHDIIYASASDPVAILKKIKASTTIDDLKDARDKIDHLLPLFLDDNIHRRHSLNLISRLNHALIRQCVHLSLEQYNGQQTQGITPSDFCFYNMGSAARGEQLIMTDQDNGMLVSDDYGGSMSDMLTFARLVTTHLSAIGYEPCPADMMASDERWCRRYSDMVSEVQGWLLEPTPDAVLLSATFFDWSYVYGQQGLHDDLCKDILATLVAQDQYIRFLAKQAIANPPPLSFFRRFIIEKDGEHRDLFDIKLRAISPLCDAARVLALDEGYLDQTATLDRFDYLAQVDPANAALYSDATEAYLEVLATRLRFAIANSDSGRYINPDDLDKLDRIHVRRAFDPARRLLDRISRQYQLSYL